MYVPEPDTEAGADWLDEWDSADSNAYQDRVEAGLEPEARPVSAISPPEWERHSGTLVQWDGHQGRQLPAGKREAQAEAQQELEVGQ